MKSEGPGNAASAALASANLGTPRLRRAGAADAAPRSATAAPPRPARTADPVDAGQEASALNQDSGGQVTETEDLTGQDPRTIARAMLPRLRLRQRPVLLPRLALHERERLERARRQPVVLRLRHPAGAPRLEDGHGRLGLGEQRGHPDPLGPRLHQGQLRHPVRRLVASSRATTGTEQPSLGSTTGGSCSPRRAPRRAATRSGRPSRRTPCSRTTSRIVFSSASARLATLAAFS